MLGSRIAALRRSAGLSQAALAERLRISPSAVGMYEQGRREPAAEILVAMADIFQVSTDYLLTGNPRSDVEQQVAGQAVLQCLVETDRALARRRGRPFSRQELTVLFAALLMDA